MKATVPSSIEYRTASEEEVLALKDLWVRFYAGQSAMGMRLSVPADGFDRWKDSLLPALGRFASVFIAYDDKTPVGFVVGRVRAIPDYLGGGEAGLISDVFVSESHRRRGIAEALLEMARHWFREQEIGRMELNVLPANEGGRAFYRKLGWQDEIIQMVLPLK